MARFVLPDAPPDQTGAVKAWRQRVVIPTYLPLPAERNPMFLERRVYQGSSGRVYPLPFVDRIAEEKVDHAWEAVHIENQFLRVMILPQIGGRIHLAMDKTNGYDFFYRQNVIKPALVGLAGPWISGGVEFNWPQHHRPSTFMPVDTSIERHDDGSVTIWCSEHEPMNRMKGMHGICLHPDRAVLELKVRLYNRTELVQTFLWWANVGTHVHERYQSFFPPDVHYVADHARRAMSRFPRCAGLYYGINYGARATAGIAPEQIPTKFVPAGDYAPNDLSWYANIPVPTSYMCMGSKEDFAGGYDHKAEAGLVQVANHHIAPGKKQWTWGNHEFGYAWERNLTDDDGPYIELMAGVFTDNQPDFSFIHPGETRSFSQYWYPIQKIGPAKAANVNVAVSLETEHNGVRLGVAVTAVCSGARVQLSRMGQLVWEQRVDLAPNKPMVQSVAVGRRHRSDLTCRVTDANGCLLVEYRPAHRKPQDVPPPATEPAMPQAMSSVEELYLTGLHLEQYRHATRAPELYWREALRREPGDARCNNAMGLWHLRRGEFADAEPHFRRVIQTITRLNLNPYDGEPYYHLGLTLRLLGRDDEACAAFYKATWNHAWQSPSFYAIAELDCRRRDWQSACEHLQKCLDVNADHLKARDLMSVVLLKLGMRDLALQTLAQTLEIDPLDYWARHLLQAGVNCDTQVRFDIALDYAGAGLFHEAAEVIEQACAAGVPTGMKRLAGYYHSYFKDRAGIPVKAGKNDPALDYCFPARLEEIAILEWAMKFSPRDPAPPYLLGNLLYDRRRHQEAIRLWERSARLNPKFPTVWRNLGIARFNVLHHPAKAKAAYEKAFAANPGDARVLFERDQLWKRLGIEPRRRLRELERREALVKRRDDLSVELCALFNQTAQHEKALRILEHRRFQPWEGGEGLALGQQVRTHVALGQRALARGDTLCAKEHFEAALQSPPNLGEARHVLANQSDAWYWLGVACERLGDRPSARRWWEKAAGFKGDFQEMSVRAYSEMTLYSALSLAKLGRKPASRRLLNDLLGYAKALRKSTARIEYFATSLPTMLLFEDDLQRRQQTTASLLEAQALLGLGRKMASRRMLATIIRQDPSHALACDLLRELEGVSRRRSS